MTRRLVVGPTSAAAPIDQYPWDESGYRPRAEALVTREDAAFRVALRAFESEPRATYRRHGDPVYRDSCLEFFLQPNPPDPRYLNFELNALGTMLLAISPDRHTRTALDPDSLAIATSSGDGWWSVSFAIPFEFLRRHFGALDLSPGRILRGNFYKCGDDTPHPHYGCWNPVTSPRPDFHRPECFGELVLDG